MGITDTVFSLCSEFSEQVIAYLKGSSLRHDNLCGSVLRREALPMSDVDVVLTSANFNTDAIKVEGVDRIDLLSLSESAPTRLLSCRSPESGFLDALPISGEKATIPYYNCFNTRHNLVNKFIWEYIYSRVFDDRSNAFGINLKYSPGCYRDILLIDRFARILAGKNQYPIENNEPEVVKAVKRISEVINISANDVLDSVAFVMLVKTTVLKAHAKTRHRGKTHLNNVTLATTMDSSELFAQFVGMNQNKFWSMYEQSRFNLDRAISMAFFYTKSQYSDLIYDDVRIALDAVQGKIVPDLEELIEDHIFNTFPIAVCILNSQNVAQDTIQRMAELYHDDPGHQYTNRLIAKSKMVSKTTLKYMLYNSIFSFDNWTNSRYCRMIEKRINNYK